MIYKKDLTDVTPDMLKGFFVGWPNPPSETRFYDMLVGSKYVWLAIEDDKVVGFVNAVSDGVLSAYIPLLEVLPAYQNQGIGTALMKKMIETLNHLYMIDLACDNDKVSYYESLGFHGFNCMGLRNYENQNGAV